MNPHGNTKGYQNNIHHVHIADGFADDCEELIHRWLKTETLTYETFCEIWKDMQFNFLYHGRSSGAEMAELSEELLQIAKHYMVSNTDNFEETVAGLFLVYALLHLQPYPRFASLRLVPEDVGAITRIETRARRERRYDVLYILGSILIEGPVQYHAANRERGMESSIRKYLEGTTGIDRIGVRPKGVFFRQNEESDLLRELNSISKRYVDAKKAIGGESCLGLNYMNETLATDLHSSLKEIINGIVEEGPEATQKMEDHYSMVQEIKAKAMRQAVHGVKHLSSVADQPGCSDQKSPKPPNPRTEPGPITRKPRKTNLKRSPRKARKLVSSSDSDSDTDLSLSSDDDTSPTDVSQDEDAPAGLSLEQFDKEDLQTEKVEEEREIDIAIESLPAFIVTEQDGKTYEIEVIDKMIENKSKGEKTKDAQDILKKSPNVSMEGSVPKDFEEGTSVPDDSQAAEIAKMELETFKRNRRREKRQLKKTALRLKFKRMGILPMAKFGVNDGKGSSGKKSKRSI